MSSEAFRAAMRRFATGVTVVTTLVEGTAHGFTANAFASVSADPPMLLICVNREAHSHSLISRAGIFGVSILAQDQLAIARRFTSQAREQRFDGVATHNAETGCPLIDGALANFDCRLAEEHTAGTHTIFIGQVVACESREGTPLGYFDGGYRDFRIEPLQQPAR